MSKRWSCECNGLVADLGVDDGGSRRTIVVRGPAEITIQIVGDRYVLTVRAGGYQLMTYDSPQTPEEQERDRIEALLEELPDALEALDRLAGACERGAVLDFSNHHDEDAGRRYAATAERIRTLALIVEE